MERMDYRRRKVPTRTDCLWRASFAHCQWILTAWQKRKIYKPTLINGFIKAGLITKETVGLIGLVTDYQVQQQEQPLPCLVMIKTNTINRDTDTDTTILAQWWQTSILTPRKKILTDSLMPMVWRVVVSNWHYPAMWRDFKNGTFSIWLPSQQNQTPKIAQNCQLCSWPYETTTWALWLPNTIESAPSFP